MTLIEDVARLRIRLMISRKEPWSLGKRSKIAEDMADYAPALLDVLGMVQEGDAEVLDAIAYHFENLGQHNEWDAKRGAVLRRYATLARKMEEQG